MQFNQKLHSSKLYNGFQFTVSALAVFSGSTYNSMKKHQETLTCFVAGTMILTASGLVAIENIKAGDKVISTYPETMETSPKTVLETYIREVTTLVHLTVNGEEIVTTVDHPFYVKNQGFIKAGELIVGDELLDVNGNVLLVENFDVELTDKPVKVYNFQVEDFHTCHVSGLAILVHNAGDDYRNVPVPERKKASNGLGYKSNPKHTPGQPGNRPNAGTEPRNSFELFGDSTPSDKNPRQRYTYEKSTGTLHRFSPTENDGSLWHWSGSTNQGPNSLKGSQVPNDIKNLFHLPKKGW